MARDLFCTRCGEPWDMDEFHEVEGMTFTEATREFARRGCVVLTGTECEYRKTLRTQLSAALFDLSGDDVDGVASDMEDAELWFGNSLDE